MATIQENGITAGMRANREPPPRQRRRIASALSALVMLSVLLLMTGLMSAFDKASQTAKTVEAEQAEET
jgi:hypothetical protein